MDYCDIAEKTQYAQNHKPQDNSPDGFEIPVVPIVIAPVVVFIFLKLADVCILMPLAAAIIFLVAAMIPLV